MELREFIKITLVSIQDGVQDAIDHLSSKEISKEVINPVFENDGDNTRDSHIEKVEFDVAVTATENNSKDAGAGIKVFSINLNGKFKKTSEQNQVSRIRFPIPIIPPITIVNEVKKWKASGIAKISSTCSSPPHESIESDVT